MKHCSIIGALNKSVPLGIYCRGSTVLLKFYHALS